MKEGALGMDKDTTPAEPRLDEDLTVEDESAEQVTGGHSLAGHFNPSHTHAAHSHEIFDSHTEA
ncbi:MAG: hypothetical protein ABSB52_11075 [Acidimicrobiales bacterium]|jgi:hypothetical protein